MVGDEAGSRAIPFGPPGSAGQLVVDTFSLYRRYPLLFLVLAAGVIVPYGVIVLVSTGAGPFARGSLGVGVSFLLSVLDLALVAPLVSALHVHAVIEAREGLEPRLLAIARRGLAVLPDVAAASIISWLGIVLGFLALIVPGVILMLRWAVVAQTAAIEHEGWLPALRRSGQLAAGHYRHIFIFIVFIGLTLTVPSLLLGFGFGHHSTTVASFLVGLVVQIFSYSFGALATALLYLDLRARRGLALAQAPMGGPASPEGRPPRGGHPLDPREHSDQDRPKGWYVDPASPDRMRYWTDGDPPGWTGTAKTPRKIKRAWAENQGEA